MNQESSATPTLRVLIVDDSPQDAHLIRRAIERVPAFTAADYVKDGEAAIKYLAGELAKRGGAKPQRADLLVLDLNMPGMDGYGVLSWLKEHPLEGLTIMVLSNSDVKADIDRAISLGAHFYEIKAPDPLAHCRVLSQIADFLVRRK